MNADADGPLKRVEAAKRLWSLGLKEDAAALIFIATAGAARLRFPDRSKNTDSFAFKEFVREQIATITNGAMSSPIRIPKTTKLPEIKRDVNVPLEAVFYSCWRCVMIHEARWPREVFLTPTNSASDYATHIALPPDGRLGLPEQWILGLADAVENCVELRLPNMLQSPCFCMFIGPMKPHDQERLEFLPGTTKIPLLTVRNQKAVPLFTEKSAAERFIRKCAIADVTVGELPNREVLQQFVQMAENTQRFVFNPVVGERPLPSYSRDTLLAFLSRI